MSCNAEQLSDGLLQNLSLGGFKPEETYDALATVMSPARAALYALGISVLEVDDGVEVHFPASDLQPDNPTMESRHRAGYLLAVAAAARITRAELYRRSCESTGGQPAPADLPALSGYDFLQRAYRRAGREQLSDNVRHWVRRRQAADQEC